MIIRNPERIQQRRSLIKQPRNLLIRQAYNSIGSALQLPERLLRLMNSALSFEIKRQRRHSNHKRSTVSRSPCQHRRSPRPGSPAKADHQNHKVLALRQFS
jgi:hypothetical protein